MKDERMQSLLDAWYRDREVPRPDVRTGVGRVMADVPQVRRRSRWWPFPTLYRRSHTPATTNTIEYQPDPIPANNGHTPTVIGRTQSMLSPAKAITAGAIVAAIGGLMLVAQPFQQPGNVPGAETEPAPPVEFTARYSYSSAKGAGEVEKLPNGNDRLADQAWVFRSQESSDPRFEGNYIMHATSDQHDGLSLASQLLRIENDAGAWQEGPYYRLTWSDRPTPGDEETESGDAWQRVLVGEGDYEGFVAVVVETATGSAPSLEGIIFDADLLPPAPEPYSPVSQD